MNQTSPAATGTAGVVIAALVAAIAPINEHFKLGLSPQDQVSIAAGIVVSAHWLAQQFAPQALAKISPAVSVVAPSVAVTGAPSNTPQ